MKKWLGNISNLILLLVLAFIFYQRMPEILFHYKSETTVAPEFKISTLSGDIFDSTNISTPKVLLFWATWCAPCKLELSRVRRMIENHTLNANSVLAISSFEEQPLLQKVALEREYRFPIGIDAKGEVSNLFRVNGTPTVVILSGKREITWFSTGISPSLEFRLSGL